MTVESITLDTFSELFLNQPVATVSVECYFRDTSIKVPVSDKIPNLPVIRLSFLLKDNPNHSIIVECNSDGETLRLRNGHLEEADMGKYGFTKVIKLAPHYHNKVGFLKMYLLDKEPVSIELNFDRDQNLSITNWGDELKILNQPFFNEEKVTTYEASLDILTFGAKAQT